MEHKHVVYNIVGKILTNRVLSVFDCRISQLYFINFIEFYAL